LPAAASDSTAIEQAVASKLRPGSYQDFALFARADQARAAGIEIPLSYVVFQPVRPCYMRRRSTMSKCPFPTFAASSISIFP